MELPSDYDSSWSSSATWTIAGGSLQDSVKFESSIIALAEASNGDDDQSAVGSTPMSPLVLCPRSPDPSPCEITVAFAQKHELRQVYVRSTARVYEIYYSPKLGGDNEYLCTVRCGVATRDDEVLSAPYIEEAHEMRIKGEGNSSTSEDDWVEVKDPYAPVHDIRNKVTPSSSGRSTQNFFEATAEITDVSPCTSITVRLLSLQNKGSLCVDEVYVFGDPVESTDSENHTGQMGDGNSLMAMLAPTLLQLSRTRGLHGLQNNGTFETREREKTSEYENVLCTPELDNSSYKIQRENSTSADQHEMELEEAFQRDGENINSVCHEITPQVSDRARKPEQVIDALHHLVSRVSRIEDLLLRFEENMLQPLNSVESRLCRVEQKLEELTKKSETSGFPSCTRYSAPEFSCPDSDCCSTSNFGQKSGNFSPAPNEINLSSSIQPDVELHLAQVNQSIPSLMVTAPEFSNADDEEEDHISATSPPKVDQKRVLSIDDALASALAELLTSTSIKPLKYTQALAVKAPEFANEEDGSSEQKASLKSQLRATVELQIGISATDDMDCLKDSDSVITNTSSEDPFELSGSPNETNLKRTYEEMDEKYENSEEGNSDPKKTVLDQTVAPAKRDILEPALNLRTGDLVNNDASNGISETSALEEADIQNQSLKSQVDGHSHTPWVGVAEEKDLNFVQERCNKDILQNVLQFWHASSVVNFEIPILDVKFTPQDDSNTKSPLEALLADSLVSANDAPGDPEKEDTSQSGDQCDLISVGDEEPADLANGGHFTVDTDYCNLSNASTDLDSEKPYDYLAFSHQGISTGSLI